MKRIKIDERMSPAFFFLILMCASPSICLGKCLASEENKRLECSNLYDFPRGTESIEVLQATNNTFIKIASNLLQQKEFSSLKVAILRYNNINTVEKFAFDGLPNLLVLDLSGNHLEELEIITFNLKILIAGRNRLKYIDEDSTYPNLLFLDLSQNNLTEPPVNLIKNLKKLKYLDISHNPLKFHQAGSFLQSNSLSVLRITLGGMLKIPPKMFSGLPNLQVLDLSGDFNIWPAYLLHPLNNIRVLYIGKHLLNESTFVPVSVEKIVQSEMSVMSDALLSNILINLDELDTSCSDIDFLQYLEDDIDVYFEPVRKTNWQNFVRKGMLFVLLVYLSLMYTLCLSQVARSLIYRPYQKLYVDEI